jgi:hypothetical protein
MRWAHETTMAWEAHGNAMEIAVVVSTVVDAERRGHIEEIRTRYETLSPALDERAQRQ